MADSPQSRLETYLQELPYFKGLRPDEIVRIAGLFRIVRLNEGMRMRVGAPDPPHLGIVLRGRIRLHTAELAGLPPATTTMRGGDRFGELALFAELPSSAVIQAASAGCEVALLDASGFQALLDDFPAAVLPVCTRLAKEVKWKNDLLRDMQEFDGSRLGPTAMKAFLATQRRRLTYRRASVARRATTTLYRTLVTDRGQEPAFWVMAGFILSLFLARAVVWAIFKFDLGSQLFNLSAAEGPFNPTHTHHFTYGFWVAIGATVLAFTPRTRGRFLRTISFMFGFGLGLIFDEWALIQNLNPDYYQGDTYLAIGIAAALMIQVIYFRSFYVGIIERATALVWRSR